MPAPALSIPVRANLDQFKKQMQETSSIASSAARKAAQSFLDMNKQLAGSAATAAFSGMAADALRLTGRIALVVGAAKLMGDAIGAARDQLKDMVDLQNKSQNVGVSSSFFQKVSAETKKLKVDAADLEGALSHAFNATKDKAPIDLSQWETGEERITEVEKALRVYNATVANGKLDGLVLFRDADTQEAKIQAVLKAMIQLESIGQRAAALDLGEKMFGTAFVDRIRQGRTSAESLLSTIQKASGDADGIFPDVLVQRAKEMDDQLKIAHQRLSTALKPSWDDLADGLLTMKGYWSDIINLIAKVVELVNQIPKHLPSWAVPDDSLEGKRNALDTVNRRLNGTSGWTETYGILASREALEAQRDRLQKEIAALDNKGEQYGPFLPSQSRGTGDAPTKKQPGSDTDKFDTASDTIEKRTAALQAEAAAIDLGTEARERSKITAQLETVAKQANAAAGKGENVVTAEQRKVIDEVADAYGKAAVEMEKAKVAAQIKFGQQTALLDPQDVAIAQQLKGLYPDVASALNSVEASAMRVNEAMRGISSVASQQLTTGLADILDGTKSVSDGFRDMSKAIVRALEEALIKMLIVQPIMRSMQSLFGFSGGGYVGQTGTINVGSYAMPQFDSGGYTGSGSKYQPAGIVHAGEVVWSQRDVARAGGVGVVEAMRKGYRGYADGGIVTAPAAPASTTPSAAGGVPSVSFGDIVVNVPQGTDINNPTQFAQTAEAVIGQVVQKKILEAMRMRGPLNRGF